MHATPTFEQSLKNYVYFYTLTFFLDSVETLGAFIQSLCCEPCGPEQSGIAVGSVSKLTVFTVLSSEPLTPMWILIIFLLHKSER